MVTVHGEIDVTGRQVFLVAGGGADSTVDLARAAKRLRLLTPLIKKSDPPGGLVMPATWPAVVQLAHQFGEAWRPGPHLAAWTAEQVRRRTTHRPNVYDPPVALTPYPWQREGAAMIAAASGALITDEPGTGKTATAILGLAECVDWRPGPVVVVCPASVVDHWVESFTAWAPMWRAVAWRGTPGKRRALTGCADVYVSSYETARVDAPTVDQPGPLRDLAPTAVVIDECHLIKSPTAMRSLAVRRLTKTAVTVIALSGTPITHHPGDLWPTLAALEPDAWPSRERWVARYCQTVPGDYHDEILGLHPATEPEFRMTLLGQTRRIAKADALELPPKVYSVRTVHLPPKWRKAYNEMESEMLAQLPDGDEISVMSVLAQLTRLSQLSSAAADVAVTTELDADGVERPHHKVTLKAPSWKVDALLEVLDERPGQPVVAFAPSRQLMQLAGAAAARAGLRVGYVVGGQSMTVRTQTVAAFQAGALDLLCATTGAGGVGLTLTAARTVVFLQRPWSLVEALQAEDRCHRIGSERHDSIEVIDVVASNTLDTRVRQTLREKGRQLADLVQDPRIVAELLGGTGVPRTKEAAA